MRKSNSNFFYVHLYTFQKIVCNLLMPALMEIYIEKLETAQYHVNFIKYGFYYSID